MLQLEDGTPFHKKYSLNTTLLPNEDLVSQMYSLTQQKLGHAGFEQYEVSNFSKGKLYQSKHNLMYWKGDVEWLACGTGAASYHNKTRFTRPKTVKKYFEYVDNIQNLILPEPDSI